MLDYQISDKAVHRRQAGDLRRHGPCLGRPVGTVPGFDAASLAGYLDIENIECQPGQKRARVSYFPGRAIADYTQLFAATALMPSHVIGDQLGIDVTQALQNNDVQAVANIAQAWNTTWDLKAGVDLKKFPSAGPYKIDSVSSEGGVVLTVNDRWWGAKPITKRITVWPRGVDVQDRIDKGVFQVVDVATAPRERFTTPDDYQRREIPSDGIEQLIFSAQGPLAAPPTRRAVALCVPRDLIARNAEVEIANARLSPSATTLQRRRGRIRGRPVQRRESGCGQGRRRQSTLTVRIGYQAPNPRLAATVGAIAKARAAAGITVQEIATGATGPQTLRDGQIDVLLASTGGASGSGSTGSSSMDAYALRTGNGNNLSGYPTRRSTASSARSRSRPT